MGKAESPIQIEMSLRHETTATHAQRQKVKSRIYAEKYMSSDGLYEHSQNEGQQLSYFLVSKEKIEHQRITFLVDRVSGHRVQKLNITHRNK